MVTQKPRRILLLTDVGSAWSRGILRGIARYAQAHASWVFWRTGPSDWFFQFKDFKKTYAHLVRWRPDACVTLLGKVQDELILSGIPIVAADDHDQLSSIPNVTSDYECVACMGYEYLKSLGYRAFAYCGLESTRYSTGRQKYFYDLAVKDGHEIYVYKQSQTKLSSHWEVRQKNLTDWIRCLPKPIALMASNDDTGQHILEACRLADVRVPEDMAVLGVDNDEIICELSYPPISSIALDFESAGYKVGELLDMLIGGQKIAGQTITVAMTHIVPRRSTDFIAVEDEQIRTALRFIRQSSKIVIQVQDVADFIGVSRRVLERKFRKTLGRSVFDEIRSIRVNQVSRMLLDTNLPISKISDILGFTDLNHLIRTFQRERGMTPARYRRQFRH